MSEIEYERSEDVVGDGDDDGDGDGTRSRDDHRKKKKGEHGFGGNLRKAKRVALFRFRKVEKQLQRRNKKSSNPSSSTPGCLGKRVVGGGGGGGGDGGGGGGGCGRGGGYYCCFKQTPTSDSPVESPTSDPNSSEFTYELLRALIETNDFYSKECNTHLDVDNTDDKLEE